MYLSASKVAQDAVASSISPRLCKGARELRKTRWHARPLRKTTREWKSSRICFHFSCISPLPVLETTVARNDQHSLIWSTAFPKSARDAHVRVERVHSCFFDTSWRAVNHAARSRQTLGLV